MWNECLLKNINLPNKKIFEILLDWTSNSLEHAQISSGLKKETLLDPDSGLYSFYFFQPLY